MEEIFIAIMERIAGMMPELSCIDEDYGQLEAGAEESWYFHRSMHWHRALQRLKMQMLLQNILQKLPTSLT